MKGQKNTLTNLTVIPAGVLLRAGNYIPQKQLERLPIWKKLDGGGRNGLLSEIQHVAGAKIMHEGGGLAMGKYLKSIYERCERYKSRGQFERISEDILGIAPRQAYRYKAVYTNVEGAFPESIVEAAVVMGLKILSASGSRPLGPYTEAHKLLPPPENPDLPTAEAYIRDLQKTKLMVDKAKRDGRVLDAKKEEPEDDPGHLQNMAFLAVKKYLLKTPNRGRRQWMEDLMGYLLTYMGISSSITVSPIAIPEDMRQGPGRPRKPHEVA